MRGVIYTLDAVHFPRYSPALPAPPAARRLTRAHPHHYHYPRTRCFWTIHVDVTRPCVPFVILGMVQLGGCRLPRASPGHYWFPGHPGEPLAPPGPQPEHLALPSAPPIHVRQTCEIERYRCNGHILKRLSTCTACQKDVTLTMPAPMSMKVEMVLCSGEGGGSLRASRLLGRTFERQTRPPGRHAHDKDVSVPENGKPRRRGPAPEP